MKASEASELRIGNYFNWSPFASMGTGQGVVYVSNIGFYSLMEPIPLTAEWLERFGFVYGPFNYVRRGEKDQRNQFTIDRNGDGFVFLIKESKKIPVVYVHQLQNLYFSLTGTELSLNPTTP
jgi:hypothetical protein